MSASRRTPRDKRPRADLPLADLQHFDACAFLKTDEPELARFMLMAALAFNDLKDLAFAEGALLVSKPARDKLERTTPERGEFGGRQAHIHRVLVAILNEVMHFIAAHQHLFDSKTFKRCLNRMPAFALSAWTALLEAAQGYERGGKGERKLRAALVSIRANIAFHYYQPKGLTAGMGTFSAPDGTRAYVSLGRSAEASRFYFADAAAQTFMNSALTAGSVDLEELVYYAGDVLDALRLLIGAYLQERRLI